MPLYPLEVPFGRRSPNTPPIVKHIVRFGRRLRKHGLRNVTFPVLVDDMQESWSVKVGARNVLIHSDGSFTASLRGFRSPSWDHVALEAHYHRWHAFWLNAAGESRRNGWKKAARCDLNIAIEERRRMTHD